MNDDLYSAQIIGVFLAETAKNVAKGSANVLYSNFQYLFHSEITTLGLNENADSDEITKQLEAKPQILETIQGKLNAYPDLVEGMVKLIKEQASNPKNINTQIYIENIENVDKLIIDQSVRHYGHRLAPSVPKVVLNFEYHLIEAFDGYEKYKLVLKMTNKSDITISNYRIHIEFPQPFLDPSMCYGSEVRERSNEKHKFIRVTEKLHRSEPLYSGDSRAVFTIDYFNGGRIFHSDAPNEHLIVKVFVDDKPINTADKIMREFLND